MRKVIAGFVFCGVLAAAAVPLKLPRVEVRPRVETYWIPLGIAPLCLAGVSMPGCAWAIAQPPVWLVIVQVNGVTVSQTVVSGADRG